VIDTAKPALVDTNVVVAGLISKRKNSPTVVITSAILTGRIPFLLSLKLVAEYRKALNYPKVAKLHTLSEFQIESILLRITTHGVFRDPIHGEHKVGDRQDWFLFDLLRTVDGALLVTGDQLLHREAPDWASVVSPRHFCQLRGLE